VLVAQPMALHAAHLGRQVDLADRLPHKGHVAHVAGGVGPEGGRG
jgi:hypothetical protein